MQPDQPKGVYPKHASRAVQELCYQNQARAQEHLNELE